MPNALSALVRKREAPKSAPPPQPGLEYAALLKGVGKTGDVVLHDLLQGEVEARPRAGGSRKLASHLAGAPDPGVYYWCYDEDGAPALLVQVSHRFAAMLTERLLGGPLKAPEGETPPSALAFDMAGALVDVLAPALNALVVKLSPGASEETFGGKRGLVSPPLVMAEIEELEMASIVVDLEIDGATLSAATTLLFARNLLERLGLVESGEAPALPTAPPGWGEDWKRNLMTAEIPLSAVAARLPSTVGDLSRLEVGQVIPLGAEALADLDLVAETVKGAAVVARGRLGAWRGRKAVKLTTPVDQAFVEGL